MRFGRDFLKVAKPNGYLVYRRRQLLPLPVKFRELTVELKGATRAARDHLLTIELNGAEALRAEVRGDAPFVYRFETPFVVPRGQNEFRVTCSGFGPGEEIAGHVAVDFSLSFF